MESEDRRRLQVHSVKVTANKLLLLNQRKTGSIAQHTGYVKRVSSTSLDTKGKHTAILPILLAASCPWDLHGNERDYWWIPGVNIHPSLVNP